MNNEIPCENEVRFIIIIIYVSGEPVKREEMMLVLERLESLRIKATDYANPLTVTLAGVSMTTTDYEAERESSQAIPTVEMCTCPPGEQWDSSMVEILGSHHRN